MPIYENVLIGNFLYGLGMEVGNLCREEGQAPLTCINLLQQTPLDTALSDALLHSSEDDHVNAVRLLEFKRWANKGSKEKAKQRHLKVALDAPKKVHLVDTSREIHWYIEMNDVHGA